MGKLQKSVDATTEQIASSYTNSALNKTVGNVLGTATDVVNIAGKAVVLAMSKAWIGLGMIRPADTTRDPLRDAGVTGVGHGSIWENASNPDWQGVSYERTYNRFDYEKLYSVQFGEYFMPLSQTFNLRAKKRMNISSLVDGIDIIQQTRKEAKTIDCTLRIAFSDHQRNLQIVDEMNEVHQLAEMLNELYETDAVFTVQNDTINNTFGVEHAIMTEYKFTPRASMGTYTFEFSLMEVKYGDNVLTFDLKQITDGNTKTENEA